MDKINEILVRLTLEKGKGNQSLVAAALDIKPQTFGNYLKGREIPVSLIIKWKKVYGEDLLALSETGVETNVDESIKDVPVNTDAVKSMPLDVWHQLQKNFNSFEKNREMFGLVLAKEGTEKQQLLDILRNVRPNGVQPHKKK